VAGADYALTIRLAACIYAADMDMRHRELILWDMLTPSKQDWYIKQAAKVLKYAAARNEPPRKSRPQTRPRPAF
jgi:hypothetical protein